MECKNCNNKLSENYLGEENKEQNLCSPCISKEEIEKQVNSFIANLNPFGWLDIKAAIEILRNMNYINPDDVLTEALENWKDSTGINDNSKIDITYLAYDWINQEVRNLISQYLNFDIQNDADFEVHGNYMCSSFDFSDEDKEKLIQVLKKEYKEDKDNLDNCLSDENGKVGLWLEYNGIDFLEEVKK